MLVNNQKESSTLSAAADMILKAVERELPDVIPRHKINKLSPSCPFNYRTFANKDSLSRRLTGQPLIQQTTIGGRCFYIKSSLMAALRNELSKVK